MRTLEFDILLLQFMVDGCQLQGFCSHRFEVRPQKIVFLLCLDESQFQLLHSVLVYSLLFHTHRGQSFAQFLVLSRHNLLSFFFLHEFLLEIFGVL